MYPHEEQQQAWANATLLLLRELLPLMSPVGRYPHPKREYAHTIGALASACARTSESVVLLCAYGQLWDSELLSRSVCEGTLKFMYLLQDADRFEKRHEEYAEDQFRIGLLKDHKKAEELLSVVPNAEAPYWKPIRERLLPPELVLEIETAFDRQVRRNLETKWGFTGLIGQLTGSNDPLFSSISGLAHSYSMSSHIMHADYTGVSIALERDLRSQDRRDSIHLSHLVGLLSSQVEYLYMRLVAGYRFVGHSPTELTEAREKIQSFYEIFGSVYEDWLACEYGNSE